MTTIAQTAAETAAYSQRLGTLKGLDLVANTTTPVPAAVATYYATNLALGSGPSGTFLTTDFFGSAAVRWAVPEKIVKTMLCGNCAAFDASNSMRKCIESGIRGDDSSIDAAATINLSDLGYCNFLHFKCAGTRTCAAWVVGGPITEKDRGKKVN